MGERKLFIVIISKGKPTAIGSILDGESYEFFGNMSAYVHSREEAVEKALAYYGIEDAAAYDIRVV